MELIKVKNSKSSNEIIDELKLEEKIKKINHDLLQRIEKLEKERDNGSKDKIEKIKKKTYKLCSLRLLEHLEYSTFHGIPNIVRTNKIFPKIMWSILTILSTCVCSYYIVDNIFDFLQYNTVTSLDVIDEQQSEFPAITICADPSFNTSIHETILKVKYDKIDKYNFSKIFDQYDDNIFGKCFRFNSGKNFYNESLDILNSTKSGKTNGLKINIYLEIPPDYDFGELLVFIHNKSSSPYVVNDGGTWIRAGCWNYFEISRVFLSKLSSPYNDCLRDFNLFKLNKTLINFILESNRIYTQSDCFYLCSQLFALEESNCNCDSTLKKFDFECITRYYNKTETKTTLCIAEYLKQFRMKHQYEKCPQYCPLECDSWSYILNNYPEQFPTNGKIGKKSSSLNYLDKFKTYEQVNKNFVAIRVHYKDLKYTYIKQEIKTHVFNFVSNIGGILGLFLGISFLSFVEFFELFYEVLIILMSN